MSAYFYALVGLSLCGCLYWLALETRDWRQERKSERIFWGIVARLQWERNQEALRRREAGIGNDPPTEPGACSLPQLASPSRRQSVSPTPGKERRGNVSTKGATRRGFAAHRREDV